MKHLQDYTENELLTLIDAISQNKDRALRIATHEILEKALFFERKNGGSFESVQNSLTRLFDHEEVVHLGAPSASKLIKKQFALIPSNLQLLYFSNALNQFTTFLQYPERYSETLWSWKNTDAYEWDHGTFCSKEEAIEDALLTMRDFHEEADTICLAKCKPAPLPTYIEADHVLGYLNKQYSSEYDYDGYLYEDVPDEHTEWLEKELSALMEKFHKRIELYSPRFTILEEEEVSLDGYERPQPINMR